MAFIKSNGLIIRHILKNANLQTTTDNMLNPLLYATQGVRTWIHEDRSVPRFLEVILTTDMPRLGSAGEVVKVAPGYFRNYLMPNFMAVPNIDKFAFLVHEQRKLFLEKEKEKAKTDYVVPEEVRIREYKFAAHRLTKRVLIINRWCLYDGELWKPVDKELIVEQVAKQMRVQIEAVNLHLPEPIKMMGLHNVRLLLPQSIPLPEEVSEWVLKVRIRCKRCHWVGSTFRQRCPNATRVPVHYIPLFTREKFEDVNLHPVYYIEP